MGHAMTPAERLRAVLRFEPTDRLPQIEWAPWWEETLRRWRAEGLPAELTDPVAVQRHFGLDPVRQCRLSPRRSGFPQTPHGQGPVTDTADYERLGEYLYPALEEDRSGRRLGECLAEQEAGGAAVWLTFDGFFWFPRTLLGIERHLYAFYDRPELIRRINRDLADYILATLKALPGPGRPVFMTFAEDMSYNKGPMLSRRFFDEFLAPGYRRVVPVLKEMGIRVFVDSDGDVGEMIPWLESVGVEGVLPLERQAGVAADELRRRHERLLMIGHFDKRVMPRGEAAMRREFQRLGLLMRSGGFVPSVDHQTPPGVSLEQYRCYLRLLREYTQAPGAP